MQVRTASRGVGAAGFEPATARCCKQDQRERCAEPGRPLAFLSDRAAVERSLSEGSPGRPEAAEAESCRATKGELSRGLGPVAALLGIPTGAGHASGGPWRCHAPGPVARADRPCAWTDLW